MAYIQKEEGHHACVVCPMRVTMLCRPRAGDFFGAFPQRYSVPVCLYPPPLGTSLLVCPALHAWYGGGPAIRRLVAPVPYSEAGDAAEVSSSLHTFAHSQGLVTGGFASCLCRRLHYLPGFVLQVRVALYPELNEKGKVVGGAGVGGGAGGSDSDDSDATVDADEPLTASAAVSAGRRGKDIHPTPISSGPSECCAGGA